MTDPDRFDPDLQPPPFPKPGSETHDIAADGQEIGTNARWHAEMDNLAGLPYRRDQWPGRYTTSSPGWRS